MGILQLQPRFEQTNLARISGSHQTLVPSFPLLRACSERKSSRRAAEQRDELATVHSITSSARASSNGGMLRPSALAVLMLITNSNLVA
jgi:hypothetical protein